MKFDAAQCLVESYSIWIMQKDKAGDEDQFAREIERKAKLSNPKKRAWIDSNGKKRNTRRAARTLRQEI